MKCPIDDETLAISQRNGVEIDYCPKCRGVWLDRGELDKIIERAFDESRPGVGDSRPDGRHSSSHRPPRKKRESFLSDLFDF